MSEQNPFLTGKVAVVTGGGGILCSVMAEALAAAGASVAVLDLKLDCAQAVADKINAAYPGKAIAVAANVLEMESLEAAEAEVCAKLGPCDILVNGAGGNNPRGTTSKEYLFREDILNKVDGVTTFFDLDPSGINFVFNLNFIGTLQTSQVFCKKMALKDGGNVINISSMNAFTPLTKIPAYSGAKAAVSNFTQWLAVHFAPCNIRCNAIAPGFFVTNQNRSLLFAENGEPTARTGKILAATPMKKFGEISDLIGCLLWLASDEASGFVTGSVIPVDGGFSAYSGV